VGGNEKVDLLAKFAATGNNILATPAHNFDLNPLLKTRTFSKWHQKIWKVSDMGRLAHSIFPSISTKPWFTKFQADRHVITKINRIISNHTCQKTHLKRIGISENQICECGEDYDTLDHILWTCSRFCEEREQLIVELTRSNTPSFVPIRDLLGGRF
jgi:hypothetical protein